MMPSFTTIGGAFERATDRSPFALPQSWLEKRKQLDAALSGAPRVAATA